jgi:hypothetical protein
VALDDAEMQCFDERERTFHGYYAAHLEFMLKRLSGSKTRRISKNEFEMLKQAAKHLREMDGAIATVISRNPMGMMW